MSGKFLGAASIYTAASIASAAVPFLMLPLLTRILTPADYGALAMFSMLVTILGAFSGLSVHGAVGVRYFEQDRFHLPSYIKTCLAVLAVSTSVVLAVILALSGWLGRVTQLPPAWLVLAALMAGAQFVIQLQLALWQSDGKPIHYGALRIGQCLLDAGLSLLMVLGLGYLWQGRAGGQVAAALVFMLGALGTLYRSGWLTGKVRRDYAADALRFGIPLVPHTIGGLLIAMTDRFMLSNMVGIGEAGIYMVALQIATGLGLLTDAFNRAYAPWLYANLKNGDRTLRIRIVRMTYFYFVAVLAVALMLGLAAPYFLPYLAGPDFLGASGLIPYLALGYAFGGMYYMVTNYIFFEGKTASLAIVTLASGLFNLLVTYYLIGLHGAAGAAQGFMLSQAMLFVGAWWLANKVHKMPWLQAIANAKAFPERT